MGPALVIARTDMLRRLRDRSAIILGLVAPLAIAALMSFAFRSTETFHFTLGIVDRDHGPVSAGLVQLLGQPELRQIVTTRTMSSQAAAADAVRNKKVAAALVIPSGFSAAATSGSPRPLTVLSSVDNTIAGDITSSIASSFVAQVNANRLSVATALAAGAPPEQVPQLVAAATQWRIPEQVVQRGMGARPLKAVSYYAPAMAIFFLLFTISFTARSFFVDQREGTLSRVLAAPVRPVQILAGKALSVFVYGLTSIGIIALVTSLAFGADWGDPLAAGALSVSMVLAVVCLTALVIGLARNERQAEGVSSVIIFGLALLGGNFVFLAVAPSVMRRLALLTPNGWALRGFIDLSTTSGGIGTVIVPIVAILAFSGVVGAAAALLARRAVFR